VKADETSAQSAAQMLERYYVEYRQLARKVLGRDSASAYIQPTELAHEAALRVFKLDRMDIAGRTHFLSLSARVMRQVLIDEVRRFRAQKRQAPPVVTQWNVEPAPSAFDIEDFHEALKRLEDIDPERARIVEQRFFAGLTIEEIAAASGVSESTVKRQWRVARAWLLNELAGD
jgi:RNA polymerase sigma factor (TIGR02999 family)